MAIARIEYMDALGNFHVHTTQDDEAATFIISEAFYHADTHQIPRHKMKIKVIRDCENYVKYAFPALHIGMVPSADKCRVFAAVLYKN